MNNNNFQCELCGNSYHEEMKVQKSTDLLQCYDCLFHMNFNDKDIINGSMGLKLNEYINIATKYHDKYNDIPCAKLSDSGGCYICMTLLDIPYDNNLEIKNTPVEEKQIDNSNKHTIQEYLTHDITIDNTYFYNTNT